MLKENVYAYKKYSMTYPSWFQTKQRTGSFEISQKVITIFLLILMFHDFIYHIFLGNYVIQCISTHIKNIYWKILSVGFIVKYLRDFKKGYF